MDGVPLDALVTRMLTRSPFDYRVAADDSERGVAYRLRGGAVIDRGWRTADDLPGGMERDEYDERAVQVIGWDGDVAMSTGRVVLPPGLPTEEACGLVVEPRGEVVDVGRMCVARSHQSLEHAALIGLMCRLYQVMREHGFGVACGMMSVPARALMGLFGLRLEILAPERMYWNEPRAPVRFSLMSATRLVAGAHSQLAIPRQRGRARCSYRRSRRSWTAHSPAALPAACPGRRQGRSPGRRSGGRRRGGPGDAAGRPGS